jgi:uncharacterized membrane protein
MGFCRSCGKEVGAGPGFCAACGTAVPAAFGAAAESTVAASTVPVAATSTMSTNMAGALAYLAGFITGIIFLVIEPYKDNSFVRFHAYQSIFFNVVWIGLWIVWMIVGLVLGAVTKGLFFVIELPINLALMAGGFCLWAFLMYTAYQQKTFRLPVIGALAAKQGGL